MTDAAFLPAVFVSMVVLKSQVEFMRFRKETLRSHIREPLFFDSHLVAYDRPQGICVLLSAKSPLIRF